MGRERRFSRSHNGVVLAVGVTMVVLAAMLPAAVNGGPQSCCFANDRYQGLCKVVPGKDETCQGLLAYLNNPMSTGKTYCGGTSIRSGWVLVDCVTGKPAAQLCPAGPTSPPDAQSQGSGSAPQSR
jgi:hypothetical protein